MPRPCLPTPFPIPRTSLEDLQVRPQNLLEMGGASQHKGSKTRHSKGQHHVKELQSTANICKPMMGNMPVTTTTKIFPKVLRYKWEAYRNTNGRRTAIQMGGVLTASISLSSEHMGTESTAIQMGGVLQYKLEVYFDTFVEKWSWLGFLTFF